MRDEDDFEGHPYFMRKVMTEATQKLLISTFQKKLTYFRKLLLPK